ncbi:MAG: ATP phosphoribosyltransferase regulatory subunit [Faecousia sp.]
MKLMREEKALFALRELYESFGYRRFQMSRFEEYRLYVQNKDFLVSDQVITFTDPTGKLMALKPDVTLSIIKNADDAPGHVQKLYYNENVYRPSGAMGAFKEIMQAGLECVGDLTGYDAVEVAYLAAKSLQSLDENYVLDISHMGLIAATLENSGLSKEGQKQALVCLHQKNAHEMKALCAKEEVDDSQLLALVSFCGGAKELESLAVVLTGQAQREALGELSQVVTTLEDMGCGHHVQVDFSCAGALKYYSGLVFKGYLPGIHKSVLSGGQYDKLLAKMGKSSRAIGFAIYMDLLEDSDMEESVLMYRIDPTGANPAQVLACAQRLQQQGSVLVSADASVPSQYVVRFENGEELCYG